MSRCAQAEAARLGTGVFRHQEDEKRLPPAAKAPTPQARHCTGLGAPGLLLCWDACPGCKHWPMAEMESRELGHRQATWGGRGVGLGLLGTSVS